MRRPEQPPRSLSVAVTTRCLAGCSYCFRPALPPRDLRWSELRPVLDRLLADGGPAEVLVSGGEPLLAWPLLRRALAHVVAAGARDRVRWTVLTDGVLLSPQILDVLAEHRTTLQVSCDGAAQELRRPGTFASLDRLLGRLGERLPGSRPRVRINATVTPRTVSLMPESCAYFLRRGVEDFRFSPVYAPDPPGGTDHEDQARALAAAFEQVLRLCLDHFVATGESPCAWLRRSPASSARAGENGAEGAGASDTPPGAGLRPVCGRDDPRHEALDADGRQVGCLTLAGRDLVAGGEAASVPCLDLCHTSRGRCADCEHHPSCPRCALPGLMAGAPGDPYRVPDFVCAFNRAALAARERFPDRPRPGFTVTHPEWLWRAVDRALA